MTYKRILQGKVSFHYHKWQRWYNLSFGRYWSGKLFYFNIPKFSFGIDCRINWIEDMTTGTVR